MTTYAWKMERLAIAFLATFIVADLWQHPKLASGVIVTTLSKVQETLVNSPSADNLTVAPD